MMPSMWTRAVGIGSESSRAITYQLDAARRDTGEKRLRRRDSFAGTPVLHGPVDDEMLIARRAKHPTERIGRLRLGRVLPDVHFFSLSRAQRGISGGAAIPFVSDLVAAPPEMPRFARY